MTRPDFKELRRLAKDRPLLLQAIKEYELLWIEDDEWGRPKRGNPIHPSMIRDSEGKTSE